ncbi:hypothetical protein JKP88DRAFT_253723 [Tribonema minus]|uniref:Rubicon Homology domain-containing protein n=1 Tax=Tribonema minus TaxID=303371 RepID=A0A836CLT2_9STRA|nr:hypothetical protein JKP88DRAFT_253723 [Tribonema minus]
MVDVGLLDELEAKLHTHLLSLRDSFERASKAAEEELQIGDLSRILSNNFTDVSTPDDIGACSECGDDPERTAAGAASPADQSIDALQTAVDALLSWCDTAAVCAPGYTLLSGIRPVDDLCDALEVALLSGFAGTAKGSPSGIMKQQQEFFFDTLHALLACTAVDDNDAMNPALLYAVTSRGRCRAWARGLLNMTPDAAAATIQRARSVAITNTSLPTPSAPQGTTAAAAARAAAGGAVLSTITTASEHRMGGLPAHGVSAINADEDVTQRQRQQRSKTYLPHPGASHPQQSPELERANAAAKAIDGSSGTSTTPGASLVSQLPRWMGMDPAPSVRIISALHALSTGLTARSLSLCVCGDAPAFDTMSFPLQAATGFGRERQGVVEVKGAGAGNGRYSWLNGGGIGVQAVDTSSRSASQASQITAPSDTQQSTAANFAPAVVVSKSDLSTGADFVGAGACLPVATTSTPHMVGAAEQSRARGQLRPRRRSAAHYAIPSPACRSPAAICGSANIKAAPSNVSATTNCKQRDQLQALHMAAEQREQEFMASKWELMEGQDGGLTTLVSSMRKSFAAKLAQVVSAALHQLQVAQEESQSLAARSDCDILAALTDTRQVQPEASFPDEQSSPSRLEELVLQCMQGIEADGLAPHLDAEEATAMAGSPCSDYEAVEEGQGLGEPALLLPIALEVLEGEVAAPNAPSKDEAHLKYTVRATYQQNGQTSATTTSPRTLLPHDAWRSTAASSEEATMTQQHTAALSSGPSLKAMSADPERRALWRRASDAAAARLVAVTCSVTAGLAAELQRALSAALHVHTPADECSNAAGADGTELDGRHGLGSASPDHRGDDCGKSCDAASDDGGVGVGTGLYRPQPSLLAMAAAGAAATAAAKPVTVSEPTAPAVTAALEAADACSTTAVDSVNSGSGVDDADPEASTDALLLPRDSTSEEGGVGGCEAGALLPTFPGAELAAQEEAAVRAHLDRLTPRFREKALVRDSTLTLRDHLAALLSATRRLVAGGHDIAPMAAAAIGPAAAAFQHFFCGTGRTDAGGRTLVVGLGLERDSGIADTTVDDSAAADDSRLQRQGWACAGCGAALEADAAGGPLSLLRPRTHRFCRLSRAVLCRRLCHALDAKRALPRLALDAWDLEPQHVCDSAARLLDATQRIPLLTLPTSITTTANNRESCATNKPTAAPSTAVPSSDQPAGVHSLSTGAMRDVAARLRRLRLRLHALRALCTSPSRARCPAAAAIFKAHLGRRKHLAVDLDLYSLSDLALAKSGALDVMLREAAAALAVHATQSCAACLARNVPCSVCRGNMGSGAAPVLLSEWKCTSNYIQLKTCCLMMRCSDCGTFKFPQPKRNATAKPIASVYVTLPLSVTT